MTRDRISFNVFNPLRYLVSTREVPYLLNSAGCMPKPPTPNQALAPFTSRPTSSTSTSSTSTPA
jgi:hypothetical protein